MLIFGITGGSGSGKTTVSDIFRSLGVRVIDADKAAREVVKKGSSCLDELTQYFGTEIIESDGSLNRKKLANIVFKDTVKLKKLNEITHSYIKIYIETILSKISEPIAAIDGAVIIGSGIENMCSFMVSVIADYDVRINRIIKRDGLSIEDAKNRLSSQPSDEFYINHSKYIIYNNGNTYKLRQDTEKIFKDITIDNMEP